MESFLVNMTEHKDGNITFQAIMIQKTPGTYSFFSIEGKDAEDLYAILFLGGKKDEC